MADNQNTGLFMTPEMYQQGQSRQALQDAIQMAQLTPEQKASVALRFGGNQLANAFGSPDPMLQRIAARNQIMNSINWADPKSVQAGMDAALKNNDSQTALTIRDEFLKQQKTEAEIVAKKREQVKVDKVGITQNTGEPVYIDKNTNEQFVVRGGQRVPFQGSVDQTTAKTNVSMSATADKSYGSELGGLIAKSDISLRDSANAAPDMLTSIQQQRALLDSGKVFTGTGANAKLNVLALGQSLGLTGADDNEIITKTQQLQQQRAKAVQSQIKSSGLGSGQGFTDKDLMFLERAAAGNISLSADTLREQLNIEEKLAKASVNKWNARVKTLPSQLTTSMGLNPVELPTTPYKPASGIPTNGLTGNSLVDKYLVNPQGQ